MVFFVANVHADELLYRYEGDVTPDDASAGWTIFNPCEGACSTSLQDGHFVLTWQDGGDNVNYHMRISTDAGVPPPPETFWVEWNFRSDQVFNPVNRFSDGTFKVRYIKLFDLIEMFGNAVFSFEGGDFVLGLDTSEFHTYRFESFDGLNYTYYVDGQEIFSSIGQGSEPLGVFLQFGGCACVDGNAVNEWDFVRYGTIGDGEAIVASDPPSGVINSNQFPDLDRFTITFDQPGYVFIDDVTVSTTGGGVPVVLQTRRLDNGDPETVQIVLDRPLSFGETTTFTFNTGGSPNTVSYTYNAFGACCLHDDNCNTMSQSTCLGANGTFLPSQTCSTVQACCLPDATCAMLDPVCCEDQGGTPGGTGSVCSSISACCFNESPSVRTCQELDPACCVLFGGNPNTDESFCDGDVDSDGWDGSCGDNCPNDRLKFSFGQCGCGIIDNDFDFDTVANCNDQCSGEDDRIDKNHNGTPDCAEQEVVIPAVSDWGMLILILMLLITIKLTFDRQPHRI